MSSLDLPTIDSLPETAAHYGIDVQQLYRLFDLLREKGVVTQVGRRKFVLRARFAKLLADGGVPLPGGWRWQQ